MTRMKNAVVVFLFIAVAVTIAVSIDYTDTYVSDRFYKALDSGQYPANEPFSLDRFLEYYDWDEVVVVAPGENVPELKTQLGLPFKHQHDDPDNWSLLFVKSYYVVAEIHIKRDRVEFPRDLPSNRFDRWSTIVELVDDDQGLRMEFIVE